MEGRGVLAVLSWAGAFDSVSSASLAARRPPSAPVAHSSRAFRDRTLGRRVLPCALRRPAWSNCLFALDAGHAPDARLAVPREGDWHWVEPGAGCFSLA